MVISQITNLLNKEVARRGAPNPVEVALIRARSDER